jgi:hypothetical protein
LAAGCHDRLVRLTFSAEPDAECARLAAEAWAPIASLRKAHASAPPGIERQKLDQQMLLPRRRELAIAKRLDKECERVRLAYVESLVAQLSELPVYSQIALLNANVRRLRNQGLIAKGSPWRIYREAVESDYYWHPNKRLPNDKRPDKALTEHLLFTEELGGKTARAFARREIPDEWFALERIAHALAALPTLGSKPKPVWAALCDFREQIETRAGPESVRQNRLRSLLEAEFKHDPKALHQALAGLLRAHLKFLLVPRHEGQTWFRDVKTLIAESWRIIRTAAGSNDSAKRNLHRLHRVARRDPCVKDALRQFFFPGLSPDELRINRPLLGKLLECSVPRDIAHLLDFLLRNRTKKPLGLIPHWLKLHEPGRDYLRDRVLASHWPDSVAKKRQGKKDSEIAADLAPLAGVPSAESAKEHFVEGFAKRRGRLGLKYPR